MKITKYKTKNGETRYKFYVYIGTDIITGKRKRTNRQGFKTITEARKAYQDLMFELEDISNRKLFIDVYNDWFEIYKLTVKESTIKTTSDMFRIHILPYFENARIDKLGYREVQDYALKKFNEYKRYKELISYLSLIFKHAIRLGFIQSNPCDLIIYPKDTKKEYQAPVWTEEELVTFLNVAKEEVDTMFYLYFYLIITTGARRGEILALNWSDINGDVISINKTTTRGVKGQIVDTPKTKKSERYVVIDEYAVELLKKYRLEQAKLHGFQDIIFTNQNGDYLTQTFPIKKLQAICEKHNLPHMTLHGLRHTYTTMLDKKGVRTKVISESLGHSNSKMTNKYTHSFITEQREIASEFIKKLGG